MPRPHLQSFSIWTWSGPGIHSEHAPGGCGFGRQWAAERSCAWREQSTLLGPGGHLAWQPSSFSAPVVEKRVALGAQWAVALAFHTSGTACPGMRGTPSALPPFTHLPSEGPREVQGPVKVISESGDRQRQVASSPGLCLIHQVHTGVISSSLEPWRLQQPTVPS